LRNSRQVQDKKLRTEKEDNANRLNTVDYALLQYIGECAGPAGFGLGGKNKEDQTKEEVKTVSLLNDDGVKNSSLNHMGGEGKKRERREILQRRKRNRALKRFGKGPAVQHAEIEVPRLTKSWRQEKGGLS